MAALRSLHIGVNRVDPTHYNTEAPLRGCENDARDMHAIAASVGYQTELALTKEATSQKLLSHLAQAAQSLQSGDTFLLTLACHGSQLDDSTGDEDDSKDETWCLYDRMFIDDEAFAAFSKFRDGTRIVVVSDSCHSGTSTRSLLAALGNDASFARSLNLPVQVGFRCIDPLLDPTFFTARSGQYAAVKKAAVAGLQRSIGGPDVILISGCQDKQTSSDGQANGYFTGHLKKVWNSGAFEGDYWAFKKAIGDSMNTLMQVPNLFPYGPSIDRALRERPFAPAKTAKPKRAYRKDVKAAAASSVSRKGNGSMENSMLHPAVYELLRSSGGSRGGLIPDLGDRGFEGGCFVRVERSMLEGKSDQEILAYFTGIVAPEMCSNFFVARDVFNGKAPRGGDVSCTASTSGGGSVSCTGTWRF